MSDTIIEDQLNYEYLLRSFYGGERRDLIGVNADAWMWYQACSDKVNNADYKRETKKIKKYIFDAMDYRLKQYMLEDNQEEIDKLLEYRKKLERENEYEGIRDLINEMYAIY